MSEFVTPNGKEINIVRDPRNAMFKIQFASGGELPQVLSGIYTNERLAKIAVIDYIDGLPKKQVKEEVQEVKKPAKEA